MHRPIRALSSRWLRWWPRWVSTSTSTHESHHPQPSSLNTLSSQAYFGFELLHQSTKSRARVGRLRTPHGTVDTPAFVAVGTNATFKHVDVLNAQSCGQQIMFCNTYHLLLHPGPELVQQAGGLHRFMNWNGLILTDSGGFQIFSLQYGSVTKELKGAQGVSPYKSDTELVLDISEEGVTFRSYRDGKKFLLSPESSVAAQKQLGADIIIPLDILPPFHASQDELIAALHRTHRWEARSLAAHLEEPRQQAMYGVVHGGLDKALRRESAEYLSGLPFDGMAIGGSMGRLRHEMRELLEFVVPLLPANRPIHLLGIADPMSIDLLADLGIDTYDSAYPTRAGRHGTVLSFAHGRYHVSKATNRHRHTEPLDTGCLCYTCRNYAVSYLHHLWKANEPAVAWLITMHNIYFMNEKMKRLREAIMRNEV